MQILVINSGSSSIKFQLIHMPKAEVACSGLVERIGLENSKLKYQVGEQTHETVKDIANHQEGLELVASYLLDDKIGVIKSAQDIVAVGHRVVHGGNKFAKTTLINSEVKKEIEALFSLAPLHNPANLEGITVAETIFPTAKQIAVFDTAFHQTIPAIAYKYAISNEFLEKHHIRMYGFHGTSHKYVSEQAMAYLGASNSSKIISLHLGNGCSATAIKDGKSIDHSLGFAPMNGLIMGTRSGDIDPSVVFYLIKNLGYTVEEANDLLNKKSGMLGLTGFSDNRDIASAAAAGDVNSEEALLMNAYRIKKFIGSYMAVLNGLDVLIFTAGIGENDQNIRQRVCSELSGLGIEIDLAKNKIRSSEITEIQSLNSKVKILVIPTNEELEIANQTYQLVN